MEEKEEEKKISSKIKEEVINRETKKKELISEAGMYKEEKLK